MGRWREAPEGQAVLPIHGRYRRRLSSPVLPIHGEVARSAGGAGCPPHSWGSSPQAVLPIYAEVSLFLPIHGEVARSAGGAGCPGAPGWLWQNSRGGRLRIADRRPSCPTEEEPRDGRRREDRQAA